MTLNRSQTDDSNSSASEKPVGLGTRAIYGLGATPAAIVTTSLSTFVLLYYNLVLGVSAPLVGGALAIALVIDGISDPLVGYVSDGFRSRWGRRHPFMYWAIAPLGLFFYALWNPPLELLGSSWLFLYLLLTVIPMRLILTLFEVPHQALLPEISSDYDERSTLATYRQATGLLGYTLLMVVVYRYFLQDTPEYTNGLLNPSGYQQMGLFFAWIAMGLMLISAGGLHHLIPRLRSATTERVRSPRLALEGVRETFADPSLRALLIASFLLYMAFGYYGAVFGYTYGFFWGLSTERMSVMGVMWGLSAVLAFLVTPPLARRVEKRTLALLMLSIGPAVTVGPALLRLLGWFPANDSPWLYPTLLVHTTWDMFNYQVFMMMMLSMLADVIDQRELATGRRSEGIIYAAYTLMVKATSGAGVLIGSMLLFVIDFPTGVGVEEVPVHTLRNFGLAYVISQPLAMYLGVWVLTRYRLTRTDHAQTLVELNQRRSVQPDT